MFAASRQLDSTASTDEELAPEPGMATDADSAKWAKPMALVVGLASACALGLALQGHGHVSVGNAMISEQADEKSDDTSEKYGQEACPCIAIDQLEGTINVTVDGNTYSYPAVVGARCEAWEATSDPACQDVSPPDYCAQPWCYVDPCNCDASDIGVPPKPSDLFPSAKFQGRPLFFSYVTCGGSDEWSSDEKKAEVEAQQAKNDEMCDEQGDETRYGKKECQCIGIDGREGNITTHYFDDTFTYPVDLGSRCEAWDSEFYTECQIEDPPEYCGWKYCYVDPCDCEVDGPPPKPALMLPDSMHAGRPIHYSYVACEVPDSWDDESLSGAKVMSRKKKFEKEKADMCPMAKQADEKSDDTSEKYGQEACPCIAIDQLEGTINVTVDGNTYSYPAEVGARCEAWEATSDPACQGVSPPDYCAQPWCYVDPCNCDASDIGVPPKPSDLFPSAKFQGRPLFFSYVTCGGSDEWSSDEKKAEAEAQQAKNDEMCDEQGDETRYGKKECQCVGIDGREGNITTHYFDDTFTYPVDLGSRCEAWDSEFYTECQVEDPPEYCGWKYCYVDPCDCEVDGPPPKPALMLPDSMHAGRPIHYSYVACEVPDSWDDESLSGAKVMSRKKKFEKEKADMCPRE